MPSSKFRLHVLEFGFACGMQGCCDFAVELGDRGSSPAFKMASPFDVSLAFLFKYNLEALQLMTWYKRGDSVFYCTTCDNVRPSARE